MRRTRNRLNDYFGPSSSSSTSSSSSSTIHKNNPCFFVVILGGKTIKAIPKILVLVLGIIIGSVHESQRLQIHLLQPKDPVHSETTRPSLAHTSNSANRNRKRSSSMDQRMMHDGWTSIDVFYGHRREGTPSQEEVIVSSSSPNSKNNNNNNNNNSKRSKNQRNFLHSHQEWYSQAFQDQAVMMLLDYPTNGYFVDLASNDAMNLSNTYAMERTFGWTGLCMEPNPMYWYNLSHFRTCQIVGAVIGSPIARLERVPFVYQMGVLGGIVDTTRTTTIHTLRNSTTTHTTTTNNNVTHDASPDFDLKQEYQSQSVMEYTVPLYEVFQRYGVPKTIDYLSFDVEGAEEYIFQSFPLTEYVFKTMTIERVKPSLQQRLESHGYQQVMQLSKWGESLWAHSSIVTPQKIEQVTETIMTLRKRKRLQERKEKYMQKQAKGTT